MKEKELEKILKLKPYWESSPDDLVPRILAEKYGYSEKAMRDKLNEAVKRGEMVSGFTIVNGHKLMTYRIIQKKAKL